jgi:hypothetical protein
MDAIHASMTTDACPGLLSEEHVPSDNNLDDPLLVSEPLSSMVRAEEIYR